MVELVDKFEGVGTVFAQRELEDEAVAIVIADTLIRAGIVEGVEDAVTNIVAEFLPLGLEAERLQRVTGCVFVDEGELDRIVSATLDEAGKRTIDEGTAIATLARTTSPGTITLAIGRARAQRLAGADVVFVNSAGFRLAAQFRDIVLDRDDELAVQRNAVAVAVSRICI